MTQVYKLLNISDLAQAAMKHGKSEARLVRKKYCAPNNAARRISNVDVVQIRAQKRHRGVLKELAQKYGVTWQCIRDIRTGKSRSKFDFTSIPQKP